jgi:hypothetical protein
MDPWRVLVSLHAVVDGSGDALGVGSRSAHRLADVVGEGGDSAAAWIEYTQEGDPFGEDVAAQRVFKSWLLSFEVYTRLSGGIRWNLSYHRIMII